MKFDKSWIFVLIHIVLIIATIKNRAYAVLWGLYSISGLFWIIGYETGWKFFRGKHSELDEVDFETSTSLYEVKSCKLFNLNTNNCNQKRKYVDYIHKQCSSFHLGRFFINPDNHIALFLRALQLNKIPKYIFVIRVDNQIIYKVLPWEKVIVMNEKQSVIKLKDIFYNGVAQQEQRAEI